jgi:hypothetical protein
MAEPGVGSLSGGTELAAGSQETHATRIERGTTSAGDVRTGTIWMLAVVSRLVAGRSDIKAAHIESLVSRCVAGWVDRTGMGHTVVGGLLLGHTVRVGGVGWGRQVIIRTAPNDAPAGLLGQTPLGSQAAAGRCLNTCQRAT